jgi:dsDNA-binding SOS-regulon protein
MARKSKKAPTDTLSENKMPALVDAKIYPRNLTARAHYLISGNPAITRPEDAVANCFPGLELDVRNLDRRFFPGLVFDFVTPATFPDENMNYGAKLSYVAALEDPELQYDAPEIQDLLNQQGIDPEIAHKLYDDLTGDIGSELSDVSDGNWYLEAIEQYGKKLSMRDGSGPLDGLAVWRIVRGLEPAPVTINLRWRIDPRKRHRRSKRNKHTDKELVGWRRLYTNPATGVISEAFQPGELMQGLCSPWQHDFRDCACHYWASNHPDVVLGEIYPGEPTTGGESETPELNLRLDWLRVERTRELAARARNTIAKNRPYQMDHFEINRGWQDLNVVLEGREIGDVYLPEVLVEANPFGSPEELALELREWLGPLELALIFEYLYARFSLLTPEEVRAQDQGELADALAFSRQNLMMVAASEMHHLRWANEILWELHKAYPRLGDFVPVMKPSELIPLGSTPRTVTGTKDGDVAVAAEKAKKPPRVSRDRLDAYVKAEHKREFHPQGLKTPTRQALEEYRTRHKNEDPGLRARDLRLLTKSTLEDFISVEHPSSFVDGAYARVVATLDQWGYPAQLIEVARRIASEGMQHESRLIAIKAALAPFDEQRYLRIGMKPGIGKGVTKATVARYNKALDQLELIIDNLTKAYNKAGHERLEESSPFVANARNAMDDLLKLGDELAAQNIGIDFFSLWPQKQ